MRRFLRLTAFLALLAPELGACSVDREPSRAPASDQDVSIEPGVRIAGVRLGASIDSVLTLLGPPTSDDAAMGKVWASWRSDAIDLDVYAARTADTSPASW